MEVPHVLAIGSLVPIQKSSPERRNQKEIIAGEERPKFLTIKQDAQGKTHLLCAPLSRSLSLSLSVLSLNIYKTPFYQTNIHEL